jgi:PAS domain S-box-containing protein
MRSRAKKVREAAPRPEGGRRGRADDRSARVARQALAFAEAAERLARLQATTAALSAASGSPEVAEAIFQVGLDALGACGGSLSFPSGGELVQVAHTEGFLRDDGGETRPARLGVPIRDAYERRGPVWIESAADYALRYPALVEPGSRITEGAWAALPLLVHEQPLGVLGIGFGKPRRFLPDDRAFMVALAQQCAQAIDRARLYEEQRRLRAEAEASADERDRLVRELRRTLRERDESMALLDALFANAPLGLALLDQDMRVVRMNGALAAMNGIPVEQHLGRTVWEILPDLPVEEMARLFKKVLDTRQPVFDLEIAGQTPAAPGKTRTWHETWYPVAVDGRVIGVGALVREVTELKQAEEFQRQLLGIVGHDLRSPLLAITSSASLLQKARELPEREAKALGRISHAAARMDGIIRALADYTLVQVGRGIPLDVRPCDLAEICRGVIEEAEAGNPGRALQCECGSPEEGEWDADRVAQIIANLVGNALKYGAEDRPVAVACRGEGADVVVEVANQGPPIAAEFVPRLFEAFRRGPEALGGRKKGLGLGLFIARQIALAHGGSIEARSSAAEGTVFTVRLPRRSPRRR